MSSSDRVLLKRVSKRKLCSSSVLLCSIVCAGPDTVINTVITFKTIYSAQKALLKITIQVELNISMVNLKLTVMKLQSLNRTTEQRSVDDGVLLILVTYLITSLFLGNRMSNQHK